MGWWRYATRQEFECPQVLGVLCTKYKNIILGAGGPESYFMGLPADLLGALAWWRVTFLEARRPVDGPRRCPEAPKTVQEGPRMVQDA